MIHGDYTERKEVRYPDREFARFGIAMSTMPMERQSICNLGITLALLTLPLLIPLLAGTGTLTPMGSFAVRSNNLWVRDAQSFLISKSHKKGKSCFRVVVGRLV